VAAKRGDGIDDDERVVLASDASQGFNWIQDARRCLSVYERDDLGRFVFEGAAQEVQRTGATPVTVEPRHDCPLTLPQLRETFAKISVDDDQYARPFAYEVGDYRLHSRRTGSGDRKCERPFGGTKEARQPRPNVVEESHHNRIQVADGWRSHRAHHAGRSETRARPKENAIGVGKRAHVVYPERLGEADPVSIRDTAETPR